MMINKNLLIFILFISFLLQVGCALDDPKPRGNKGQGMASFYPASDSFVGKLSTSQGQFKTAQKPGEKKRHSLLENWGFSQHVSYDYKVCFKDVQFNESLPAGHQFTIQIGASKTQESTDEDGCLKWRQKYPFEFFADPHYLNEKFEIASSGIHKGSIELNAAINPWVHAHDLKIPAFLDLANHKPDFFVPYEKMQKALSGQYLRKDWAKQSSRFVLSKLKINIGESHPEPHDAGSLIKMNLSASVSLELRNHLGAPNILPVNKGLLRFRPLFVREKRISGTKDDIKIELINSHQYAGTYKMREVRIESGKIQSEFNAVFKNMPSEGTIGLYLTMEAHESLGPAASELLGSQSLYYVLTSADSFKGLVAGQLETKPKFLQKIRSKIASIFSLIKTSKKNPRINIDEILNKNEIGGSRDVAKFYFKPMSYTYDGIDSATKSATYREVRMTVTACALDPMTREKLKRVEEFHIQYFDLIPGAQFDYKKPLAGKNPIKVIKSQKTRLENGCLNWFDSVGHHWFNTEEFYVRPFVLVHKSSGVKHYLFSVINPWNTSWIFAKDIILKNPEDLKKVSKDQPQLKMSRYGMSAVGTSYEIDDQLELWVKKRYNFTVAPNIVRHDSIEAGLAGFKTVRSGYYIMKIALVKSFEEFAYRDDLYVNSWQQIVKASAGVVVTPLSFRIEDLTLMNARNFLLLELTPVHQDKLIFKPNQQHLSVMDRDLDQKSSLAVDGIIDYNSGLMRKTFFASFTPSLQGQGPVMIELRGEKSVGEIIKSGKAHYQKQRKKRIKEHNLTYFDRVNRLKHIDLAKPEDREWLQRGTNLTNDNIKNFLPLVMNEESGPQHKEIQFRLGEKLCSFWVSSLLPKLFMNYQKDDAKFGVENPTKINYSAFVRMSLDLIRKCKESYQTGNNQGPFFKFDRKIVVNKIDKQSVFYEGGASYNYNVSANFGLSKDEEWGLRRSQESEASWSMRVGSPGLNLIGLSAGLGRSDSWGSSSAHAYGMNSKASFSYGSGAYLVIQHSLFRFNIVDYKRCLVVKPRFQAMQELLNTTVKYWLDPDKQAQNSEPWFSFTRPLKTRQMQDEYRIEKFEKLIGNDRKLDVIEGGLRLCLPAEQKPEPLQVLENYYYVTQHFTTGDMHDSKDLRNRPWLLEIRSQRDFAVFLNTIHKHNNLNNLGETSYTPDITLNKAYADYRKNTPSFPGIYSIQKFDPYRVKECNPEQQPWNIITDSITKVPLGWKQWKSGTDIDFWKVFHCSAENRNEEEY